MPMINYPRFVMADADGNPVDAGGSPKTYTLLTAAGNGNGTAVTGIRGGDYVWRVSGTFGGATVTLQQLDLDGTTWVNVRNAADSADVTRTTAGQTGIGVGQGASLRAVVSGGTGASLNSTLAGLS